MTEDLTNKKCIACEDASVKPLSEKEIEDYLSSVKGWELKDNSTKIYKEHKFKNFKQALEFTNKVGNIAEDEGHHPDLELGWGYVNITLQTHNINGLHINDFIVASKIDMVS